MAKKRTSKSSKKPAKRTLVARTTRSPAAAKTASGKRSRKGTSKTAKRRVQKKSKKPATAPVARRAHPRRGALALEGTTATSALVVVEMSNNGPHDIRAITVDQVHVVENVSTTSARSEFDISAHFEPPTRIGWEIFAGIQFPRAGIFLERPGRPTQTLGQQAPLKKGAPWLDEKPVN